ncbi:diguanylate cyclase [Psychrobacillus sp. FSL K6-2365]|jgi:diguanylate cyclase (GGDEF)-like protein|uniref:sensor domain-containing diguanylate cyclase n=1 Tax=Psychrobacillus TaxID=1221880 RepID=UPI0008EB6AA9|nr:diguanylate cyclase [Psychrobacillus psychrodurans]MCZ8541812.1 diguanylate cyclase [Psychrobacillus psychrodurans]SFN01957.1 diguanylate cyclase (GGDEF) domain-containing protein [Psychrobacillus psychrodurans]
MESKDKIIHLKSGILDVWNESVFTHQSSIKWFEDLQEILFDFFGIQKAKYFIYDAETFLELSWNHSFSKKLNAIKWAEIETFFYDKDYIDVHTLQIKHSSDNDVALLLRDVERQQPLGLIIMETTEKWKEFSQTPQLDEFIETITKLVKTIKKSVFLTQQENQYRNLFNVTKMFNSTLDIGQILEGTLHSIQLAFPKFESILILSNDQERKTSVPYKLFDYTTERNTTVEAYVSGEITTELAQDLGVRLLNIPIVGKQGIYGILQISAPLDYLFSIRQKDFAILLAEAAGNALENAKLYIQSHRLVSDLQLINETSHKLNMNLSLEEMLVFLRDQLIKFFQPEHVGFVFIENDEYKISSVSTDLFHTIDGQLYIQYVTNHFKTQKDSIFIADFNRLTDLKYEYRSLVAIPLKEQSNITGFSIIMHQEPYYFSFDNYKLMQSLIQHSSLAISNSTLRNKLQKMVDRDHLTNLFARNYLDRYVEKAMDTDDQGVFVLIDIDNFKRVNDTHGHQIGDEILKQIARVIQGMIKNKGISARWGGEELALYFSHMSLEQGIEMCEQLLVTIPQQTSPSVTVSIGISNWHRSDGLSFNNLFHNADTVLYKAKNNGKNQLRVYKASHSS